MGEQKFSSEILAEAKEIVRNKRLRQKDIVMWSQLPIPPRSHENVFYLPLNRVYVSVTAPTPEAPLQAPKYHARRS